VQTTTKPITVTISIGVALTGDFPEHDVNEIIDAADVALYAAKAAWRNCVPIAQSLPAEAPKEAPQQEALCWRTGARGSLSVKVARAT